MKILQDTFLLVSQIIYEMDSFLHFYLIFIVMSVWNVENTCCLQMPVFFYHQITSLANATHADVCHTDKSISNILLIFLGFCGLRENHFALYVLAFTWTHVTTTNTDISFGLISLFNGI